MVMVLAGDSGKGGCIGKAGLWSRISCLCTGDKHMKLSIDIDDRLLNEALRLTKLKNDREVIELGLKTLIRLKDQSTARQENSSSPTFKEK
jgi:Arc/MetJ family transcription regulator